MEIADVKAKRSSKVVRRVRLRDGDICQCCGRGDGCEVHHIHPICYGGEDSVDNAICLCNICHKHAPDDPTLFLAYQRKGGAHDYLLQDVIVKAHSQDAQKHARECFLEWTRMTSNGEHPIDDMRLHQWGWTTGRNALMRLFHDRVHTAGQTASLLFDRISQASKHLQWLLVLQGSTVKVRRPRRASELLDLALSDVTDRSISPILTLARCHLEEFLLEIEELLDQVSDWYFPAGALSTEYHCAIEDLLELCDWIKQNAEAAFRLGALAA